MKRFAFLLVITTLLISCSRNGESDFEKHFIDKTLRVNLIHTGNDSVESFKLNKIYDDGLWYGRTKNLINPYRLGEYLYEVRDVQTDELLYSDVVSTVFGEWKKTGEAKEKTMSFNESIRIPYPQNDAKLLMYKIDSLNIIGPIWEHVIDDKAKSLVEPAKNHNNRLVRILDSGNPKEKVDIVILGDGYTKSENAAFDADVQHFYNTFINTEPFKSRKSDFNVHAIQVPPTKNGNTLKTSYGAFGHERYALAYDEWTFREYATQSPYDYAVILMNDDRKGGGSLYNVYTISAIRSQSEDFVVRHEIGHQIVGTADRFFSEEDVNDTLDISYYYDDFSEMINKILDLHTK